MSGKWITAKFKVTREDIHKYRMIILVSLLLSITFAIIAVITATSKPAMTEVTFSFDEKQDNIIVNIELDKNDKLYYAVKSDNEVDIRIMTDYEGSSWTEKDYHHANDKEYVYDVLTADTYTIRVDYGDQDATGKLLYGASKDNSGAVTVWAIASIVSLFGGYFVALTFVAAAERRLNKR